MNNLLKEKIRLLEELVAKSNEISTFYGKIIDNNATFLYVHGIKASAEEIETGARLRKEFYDLKEKYTLTEQINADHIADVGKMVDDRVHKLKTWPEFFDLVVSGKKTFEIRTNDRDFKVGDRLDLLEYDPEKDEFTGNHCHRYVTHILGKNPFIDLQDKVILSLSWDKEDSNPDGLRSAEEFLKSKGYGGSSMEKGTIGYELNTRPLIATMEEYATLKVKEALSNNLKTK